MKVSEKNWICCIFGHRYNGYTDSDGINRMTCSLDGHTVPPFRKIRQEPPYDYLPENEQPWGAV